jgi:hypothetical protein
LIPVEDQSPSYFLGPVGTSDPSKFIAAESQRIPLKAALSKPHEWQDAFKNWPLPPIAGWRNWYKRMLENKHQGCYSLPPLTRISSRDRNLKTKVRDRSPTVLDLQKPWIVSVKIVFSFPCGFLFCIMTP